MDTWVKCVVMTWRRAVGRLFLWFIDPVQDERARPVIDEIEATHELFANSLANGVKDMI
jgi:hypothetical protein